jgi:hypothetical protein
MDDQANIECCDRAWIAPIRRYLVPHDYEMLPATMVRLM